MLRGSRTYLFHQVNLICCLASDLLAVEVVPVFKVIEIDRVPDIGTGKSHCAEDALASLIIVVVSDNSLVEPSRTTEIGGVLAAPKLRTGRS